MSRGTAPRMKPMIDNLIGMAHTFDAIRNYKRAPDIQVAFLARRLTRADMGAASVQRYLPGWYHDIVNTAKRWLRDHPALA